MLTCADDEQQSCTQIALDCMRRHTHLPSVDGGMPWHPQKVQRMWQRGPVRQRLSVLDLITICTATSDSIVAVTIIALHAIIAL